VITLHAVGVVLFSDGVFGPVFSRRQQATGGGFVFVGFVVNLNYRMIVGWFISTVGNTSPLEMCLAVVLRRRDHAGYRVRHGLIHHFGDADPNPAANKTPA
jgi:hypothetical protein